MKLIYGINDRPPFGKVVIFAIQQLLAIMTATLVVPVIINGNFAKQGELGMSPAAALFGAGIGTLVYLMFTKFRSPVFLGSSFAFIGSMTSAVCGAISVAAGYAGMIIGAVMAGLVYVIIALVVKLVGVKWIDKIMPPVVIGPTVAIIGLSLAGNAVKDFLKGGVTEADTVVASPLIAALCGLVTLVVTVAASTYGKKMLKMIPFIIGILAGYAVSAVFTVIGDAAGIDALCVLNFSAFDALLTDGKVTLGTFFALPPLTFTTAINGFAEIDMSYITTLAMAYVPVAFVVFAEHLADHKNISSIIEKDLLEEPGLHRTLLGDGVGSMFGAFFGGCPNTTYGESIGCVAISGNASVVTIFATALAAILVSFFTPFVAFVNSIPPCVMGGVCTTLYGFIAVSGLKMISGIDLGKNRNLFVVSVILIAGVGGLKLSFGKVELTSVACALILGIIVNLVLSKSKEE